MNGHNEDSIERGTKIRRVTDREVRAGIMKNADATLRKLQEANALIGLLGKQRDEARAERARIADAAQGVVDAYVSRFEHFRGGERAITLARLFGPIDDEIVALAKALKEGQSTSA